jgi:hypothetical protein
VGEFLGGQLGTIGLTFYPVLWFASLKSAYASWKSQDQTRFFLVWLALPMMSFFVYTGCKAKVEANWPQIAYISAMLIVAEWLCATPDNRRKKWVLIPSALLAALVIVHSFTLILPLPAKSDISTRLHGWQKMGETLQKIDEQLGKEAIFVGQGYGLASLAGFYGKIPPERVAEIHNNGNFAYWWQNRALQPGTDMVYIDDSRHSEALVYVNKFADAASQTLKIDYAGRQVQKIGITTFKDLHTELKFK